MGIRHSYSSSATPSTDGSIGSQHWNDDHVGHDKALHDALGINAATLGGISSSGFSTSNHEHAFGMPAGAIQFFANVSAPSGWLPCDGSAVSRSSYGDLFDAIGTQFGSGNGSTTFNVPDLRGRVLVGIDTSQTEFDSLGETGGEKTHTLSLTEIPSHTHSVTLQVDDWFGGSGSSEALDDDATGSSNTHSYSTDSSGSGAAHNNLQPYMALHSYIKY